VKTFVATFLGALALASPAQAVVGGKPAQPGQFGYVANVQQSPEMLASMRTTVALVPLLFLALSSVAMLFNPLGRRTVGRVRPAAAVT